MGENPLSGHGPIAYVNRLVRTRLLGGVGAGGEKPPATRLDDEYRLTVNLERTPKLKQIHSPLVD